MCNVDYTDKQRIEKFFCYLSNYLNPDKDYYMRLNLEDFGIKREIFSDEFEIITYRYKGYHVADYEFPNRSWHSCSLIDRGIEQVAAKMFKRIITNGFKYSDGQRLKSRKKNVALDNDYSNSNSIQIMSLTGGTQVRTIGTK